MAYQLKGDRIYRMPIHFGPTPGPRQAPGDMHIDDAATHSRTTYTANYLTHAKQLEEFLPPQFNLRGEPLITAEMAFMSEIEWLAGRGYNLLSLKIPVHFRGSTDRIDGVLVLVLWENLPDAVLSGRDEIGYNKIYGEIPQPRIFRGKIDCSVSWLGFQFFEMHLLNSRPCPPSALLSDAKSEGSFHVKYIPRTGELSKADAHYVTFSPKANPPLQIQSSQTAEVHFQFHRAKWEDLPTMFHIVNPLADLELLEPRGGTIVVSRGFKDLSDQRIVR